MGLTLVDTVQEALETDRFGHPIRGFESVGSTNTRAAAWAEEGAAEGSVVVTEYQSEGRGRHGRTWDAPKGQNLMFSVVLRPSLPPDRFGLITVAASVAVAEAVEAFVEPHRPTLKWPNDVLLEGRKTCGMLLESSLSGTDETVVVLGVGLNVNQTAFPEALADSATSLRLTTGRTVPRSPLFARLLHTLERRYTAIQRGADAAVRAAFEEHLTTRGEQTTLRFTGTDRTVTGTVQGITKTGALRLDTPDGPRTLHAGEVTSQ